MASDGRPEFDPKEIARAAFPTAFRGYDQDAVRRYLTRLAAAVGRAQQTGALGTVDDHDDENAIRVVELEHEAEELRQQVASLTEELETRPVAGGGDGSGRSPTATELSEDELIELLGHETARIVASARSAAAEIVERAESRAAELGAEAEREAEAAVAEAETMLGEAKAEAESMVDSASAEVRKGQARLKAEAERARAQARADADEILVEAATKADNDLAAARARSEQIVSDAERMRDEVLGDLVRRRRSTQEQLDRLTAARDRLTQALAAARNELDDVAAVIQHVDTDAIDLRDDAPIAMGDMDDAAEVARLVAELGPTEPLVVESRPEESEVLAGVANGNGNGAHAAPGLHGGGDGLSALATGHHGSSPSRAPATAPPPVSPAPAPGRDDRSDEIAFGPSGPDWSNGPSRSGAPVNDRLEFAYLEIGTDRSDIGDLDLSGHAGDPVLGTDSGELHRSASRGDLPRSTPYHGQLPAAFEGRDLALNRATPGFRRRLKRAVNDDQSDVLDRLRAGRGPIQPAELPALEEQLERFVQALRPAMVDVAASGAELLNSVDVPRAAVENLCIQLARHMVDCLRLPTLEAIEESVNGDREAILDPVRAIYRDFRNGLLPDLIEDALHESFALGLHHAIESDERVLWLTDPRLDPDPICEQNSASAPLDKGEAFPSGHVRPLSMPGCRCLAIPAV